MVLHYGRNGNVKDYASLPYKVLNCFVLLYFSNAFFSEQISKIA